MGEEVSYIGCYSLRVNGLKGAGYAAVVLIVALLVCQGIFSTAKGLVQKKYLIEIPKPT